MNKKPWALVALRELAVRITDKTFIIGNLSTLGIMALIFGVNAFLANQSHELTVATSTASAGQLVQRASDLPDDKTTLQVLQVPDRAAVEAAIRDGRADAYVYQDSEGWTILGDSAPEASLRDAVQQVVQQDQMTQMAGESGRTIEALQRAMNVEYTLLNRDMESSLFMFLTSLVFAVLFYMASIMFGMTIANSVIQEKESRIVEIIASAIPLRDLLLGKVLANVLLAFGQILLYLGAALVGLSFTQWKSMIPQVSTGAGWFVVFFVVGFTAQACVWAMAGALASRTEEVSATTTPITMGLAVVLFSGLYTSGTILGVLSYVPIAASIAMPRRLLEEADVPVWQPLLSLGISVVFTLVVIQACATVYQRALMQTSGGKLSIRAALAAQR